MRGYLKQINEYYAGPGHRAAPRSATVPLQRLFFQASVATFLALSACSHAEQTPTDANEGVWTIRGITYFIGSLDPVPGVVVSCAGATVTSGPDGSYAITNVPAGTHLITAEKQGVEPFSHSIDLLGNLTYHIFLSTRSTNVWGIVSNIFDGPVADARVSLHGLVDYTDLTGRYQFSNVPQGVDTLSIAHPKYLAWQNPVTLNAAQQQLDVVLKRDSVIVGRIFTDTYVDGSLPSSTFYSYPSLLLSAPGYDNTGRYVATYRNILINFEIPEILRSDRISLIDAKLELCTDGAYPSFPYQVAPISSAWTYSVTFNKQPAVAVSFVSGTIGDGSAPKYWTILGIEDIRQIVTAWRAPAPFYGVMIYGGGADRRGFYSGRSAQNKPRVTFTIRY